MGESVNRVPIRAIRISDNPTVSEPGEPKFKYVGNMHGNEVVGREILLHFIRDLLCGYGHDDTMTSLVNSTDIYILPTMNPDGYAVAQRYEESGCVLNNDNGRPNANRIDLNRNFPDQFASQTDSIQPETKALMDWITSTNFVLSANFHGGSVVASYPYDDTKSGASVYSASPDDDVFRLLALTYSHAHATMAKGVTCPNEPPFPDGITNGAAWYDVAGGMQDYNYLHSNCFEITVELSCCKFPPASQLSTEWDNNREALIAYMQRVHMGVKGFVLDNSTGEPVVGATISVNGRDHSIKSGVFGDYWRLLVPDQQYTLQISADGYQSVTVNAAASFPATSVNVSLVPSSSSGVSSSKLSVAVVVLSLVLVIPAITMLSIWIYRIVKARRNFYSALKDSDLDQTSFVKLTQREKELFGDDDDDEEDIIVS